MFDWLLGSAKELPVWGQLTLDAIKIVLGFVTVLLVTRWTLARADRKDVITRQANALDAYCSRRVDSLDNAVVALGRICIQINKVLGALAAGLDGPEQALAADHLLGETECHIDQLMLALESYGNPPGSLASDFYDIGEALVQWLKRFYEIRNGVLSQQSVAAMLGMCSDLQGQIRFLGHYELNMRLQVALNPASAWNPDFGGVLETAKLEFLTKPPDCKSERKARVIGTVVEVDDEGESKRNKKVTKRVFILGPERSTNLFADTPVQEK